MDRLEITQRQEKNLSKGYIQLYRSIWDSWIWKPEKNGKFDNFQAWIDLVLMVNYEDRDVHTKHGITRVHRGEKVTSMKQISERWGWHRNTVKRFLTNLERAGMLTYEVTTIGIRYNIVNYDVYNNPYIEKYTPSVQQNMQQSVQQSVQHSVQHPMQQSVQHSSTNKQLNNKTTKQLNNKTEIYSRVVSYLNEKAGKAYRPTTNKTKSLIDARLNEGFELEDFKTVIDKKTAEWLGDEKMDRYLRPETLFGPKFEGYLNEKPKQQFSKSEQKQEQPKDPYDDGNDIMDQLNEYYRNLERQEANG